MGSTRIGVMAGVIVERLDTLAHVLRRAEREGGPAKEMLSARIAPDMFPFSTQVVFAARQAKSFAMLCGAPEMPPIEDHASLGFEALAANIAATRAAVVEAAKGADDGLLGAEKRVTLPDGRYIPLVGQSYVDDWVMPNLYFHLAMAYALVRGRGVAIGKADWMAHLGPRVVTP